MATVTDRWATEPDKRSGRLWQVRWRDEQKNHRRKAFARKFDAERFAAKIQRELDIGTYKDPRDGNVPFGTYAETWFTSQLHLRPATRTLYRGMITNHLKPVFGSIPLSRLTIDQGRTYLADDRRSPSMRSKTFTLLRRILNDAITEQLIPANPLISLQLPKAPQREASFVTLQELDTLVDAIHPHFRTLVRTAAFLGLRQGELLGLHPDNLDLQSRQVRVIEQLSAAVRPPERVELKTKSSRRTVAIPAFLIEELLEQLEERASKEFLFTAVGGGPILKSNFARRYWMPACNTAGLDGLRFHELRHTAATFAIQAGAHPKALQSRLGHSSITVTMDCYGHLMPGTDDDVAAGIDSLVAAHQPLSADVVPHPALGADLRQVSPKTSAFG
ncbi:MAG: integrase [Acidimicrobiales bacterium]|jgi:integrase